MANLTAHWKYAKYVVRHKWYVFQEARQMGIPWLGLTHDLSKFRPSEWFPYTLSFYGPWKYADRPAWLKDAFDRAWLSHIHANKHHWQHWLLHLDDGGVVMMPMPDRYRREMIADWRGAGMAQGTPDTKAWFVKHKSKGRIALHPETEIWVRQHLGVQ